MRKGTVCQKHIAAQGDVRKIPISNTSQYQGDFIDVGGAAFALGRCAQSKRIAFMPSHARRTWSGSQRCQITNPTAIRLRGQQVSHEWCAASAMTTLCKSWISTSLKRRPLIDDWRAGHEHQTGPRAGAKYACRLQSASQNRVSGVIGSSERYETQSELTRVEPTHLRQLVERKLVSVLSHAQVLDFACFPVIPAVRPPGG